MNQKEAALARCIVDAWHRGFGRQLLEECGVFAALPNVSANLRLPVTDIAWRELDLVTEQFLCDGVQCRLVVELKNGALGYGSMGQVMFYKHVLLPRHLDRLQTDRVVFAAIGDRPNPKRWYGEAAWESDADAFLALFKTDFWPDPDIHGFSYEQLGLTYSVVDRCWYWRVS